MNDVPAIRPNSASRTVRAIVRTDEVLKRGLIAMWRTFGVCRKAAKEAFTFLWLLGWIAFQGGKPNKVVHPMRQMQLNAEAQRNAASRVTGNHHDVQYEPEPPMELVGRERLLAMTNDPQRARDLRWHAFGPALATFTVMLPAFITFVMPLIITLYCLARDTSADLTHWLSVASGASIFSWLFSSLACAVGGVLLAHPMRRLHAKLVEGLLCPPEQERMLHERVEKLADTRRTALDLQAAEIQRIERDLHDGAQAKLVSIGMTLTQVERLLARDPEAAKELLHDAKGDSVTALQELRALVRGIRPPVLADRGLAEALRSMASSLPLETKIASNLASRPMAAVESALYFAAAELMTNAAKHSAGARIDVEIVEDAQAWRVTVTDDGIGGAEDGGRPDGGLAGIQRRLDPFDGVLTMVSPVGGGTTATVIVPKPRN